MVPAASCGSVARLRANSGLGGPGECRICLLSEPASDLIDACHCTGSLKLVHLHCLRTWVIEKRSIHCELCGTMYKEPYGSELAASIPPAPPPQLQPRRFITLDGQSVIVMPMGLSLGPGGSAIHMGPLLQHAASGGGGGGGGGGSMGRGGQGAGAAAIMSSGGGMGVGVADPRELEPQPLCEWRNMWSYVVILLLLLFAILYVTVISKRGKQEPWMMTLWQVLLVILPIYLLLRVAFDLYRHRLAQQLAAANLQAMALANAAVDAAAVAGGPHSHSYGGAGAGAGGGPRDVIITRSGNRVLVLQRAV
ncbi:hypothetical protein HYH02_014795 [Chlamydomonas schloesseri]|uniref:RING-CH-type domain-containing protein n=1 Tax=Chlamydomonas schloesseri TaxID=2026947 RepID=A0A835SK40_9CHLO|nr:hypothetical protein HYH02_014795 [Chlamydomonas schloesseri]|eukprot:KAG2426437.1 hypothetical protein HYH02_014795 [Chlamydomonas schloesseri]